MKIKLLKFADAILPENYSVNLKTEKNNETSSGGKNKIKF